MVLFMAGLGDASAGADRLLYRAPQSVLTPKSRIDNGPSAMNAPRPTEPCTFPGPAGLIEGLLDHPVSAPTAIAVVCHPHPLQRGTMQNKVAYMLARAFNDLGAVSLRFNFRGVGRSAGTFDHGMGETDDALAAIDWLSARHL